MASSEAEEVAAEERGRSANSLIDIAGLSEVTDLVDLDRVAVHIVNDGSHVMVSSTLDGGGSAAFLVSVRASLPQDKINDGDALGVALAAGEATLDTDFVAAARGVRNLLAVAARVGNAKAANDVGLVADRTIVSLSSWAAGVRERIPSDKISQVRILRFQLSRSNVDIGESVLRRAD